MNINNPSGQKYLSEVRRHLKCTSEAKRRLLATLTPELHNFELEHPDASYADYTAALGEPKAAAQKYLDELSDREVFGYWKHIIAAVIVAAMTVILCMICYFIAHIHIDTPIYHADRVVSAGDAEAMPSGGSVITEESSCD